MFTFYLVRKVLIEHAINQHSSIQYFSGYFFSTPSYSLLLRIYVASNNENKNGGKLKVEVIN
jgi:hypothetical protein